jgi:hypothetical protein
MRLSEIQQGLKMSQSLHRIAKMLNDHSLCVKLKPTANT